jgi:hypothetical protein
VLIFAVGVEGGEWECEKEFNDQLRNSFNEQYCRVRSGMKRKEEN